MAIDIKLTTMMVEDFIQDPVLAVKVIFDIDLMPHQELRLMGMWRFRRFIDSSGFGTGKTTTLALCAALRHILLEERSQLVISRTFEQGKTLYEYFDKWISTSPIFRSQIALNKQNQPSSSHGQGAHILRAKNGNIIRVIPPNFNQDADRAKSEDATDGYFDEWTAYPDYKALYKTLIGRVRRPVSKHYQTSSPIFGPHWCFTGTPQFKWHESYEMVERFSYNISKAHAEKKRPQHELQSWNWTHYQKTGRFQRFYETLMATVEEMEEANAPSVVEQEILGHWIDDSFGWYSAKEIEGSRDSGLKIQTQSVAA